ncbi:MAG: transcription elongation factor GreA [Tissierellia bacterium]|nr:transcription elongation factor GreA [Tissierellia bacterium]
MVEKDIFITAEGLEKLENEIEELKTVGRKEVAERIKVALGYGDLSENSEYDEAKNEQAQLEERIAKLENMVRKARVIREDELQGDTVNVGTKVTTKDQETGEEEVYELVGSAESDPLNNKISNESPIGSKLMGLSVGDVTEIEVPDGKLRLEVTGIEIA